MNASLNSADGHAFQAYVTGDEQARRGLIVLQEIFGVNAQIRDTCDRFAQQGYRVIAPALFDRRERGVELDYTAQGVQRGLELRNAIPVEQTLLDLQSCIQTLDLEHIGIVGYCWGGSLSWQAACKLDGLQAASCWYGSQIAQAAHLTPRIPVQMHFGQQDHSIPASAVQTIRSAQPQAEIYEYPEAGHGFGCQQRADFHAPSYELAQQRTLAFFDQHLR